MTAAPPDEEAARLEGLGYTLEFKREMSLAANFSLVALSAIVGVGIGAIHMLLAKPYLRSDARSGAAVPTQEGVKE